MWNRDWEGYTKKEIVEEAEEELLDAMPIAARGYEQSGIRRKLLKDFTRDELIQLIDRDRFHIEYLARSPIMADRARAAILDSGVQYPPEKYRIYARHKSGIEQIWLVVFADDSCIGEDVQVAYWDIDDAFEDMAETGSEYFADRTVMIVPVADDVDTKQIRAKLKQIGARSVRTAKADRF